jgi:hypothetical protein
LGTSPFLATAIALKSGILCHSKGIASSLFPLPSSFPASMNEILSEIRGSQRFFRSHLFGQTREASLSYYWSASHAILRSTGYHITSQIRCSPDLNPSTFHFPTIIFSKSRNPDFSARLENSDPISHSKELFSHEMLPTVVLAVSDTFDSSAIVLDSKSFDKSITYTPSSNHAVSAIVVNSIVAPESALFYGSNEIISHELPATLIFYNTPNATADTSFLACRFVERSAPFPLLSEF